ncbi:MAG: cytochrome c biogenesis protein CcsA [Planctomycetes bacterium]|nr:cytochrome c biogenesis protein CcsA [Planctomycetota bacterium]
MKTRSNWNSALLLALALVGGGATVLYADDAAPAPAPAPALAPAHAVAPAAGTEAHRRPWSADTVELLGSLPVQDGGRVKPLSTLASFRLLRFNGRRSCADAAGERLTAMEWLLDCLFFPEVAVHERCFLVENDEVLDAVGLAHEGRTKRDRYAYADLESARDAILQKGMEFSKVEDKERTPVQSQMVRLAESLRDFEQMVSFLDFARQEYPIDGTPALAQLFSGATRPRLAALLARSGGLQKLMGEGHNHGGEAAERTPGQQAVDRLLGLASDLAYGAQGLALLPPGLAAAKNAEWWTPWEVALQAFSGSESVEGQVRALGRLEEMAEFRNDPVALHAVAEKFRRDVVFLAEARGEYAKVPVEVFFYKGQFFFYAQLLFLVGFLAAGLSWLWPRSRALRRVVPGAVASGWGLLVLGIVLRCVIRSRPPVSTLYETILFISAVSVLAALVAEFINRQGIAIALASFVGALGMFLADKYEAHEAVDTMPSLVAVLDTNFWLATHVTCVTTGYAAGLFASAVAHVYLLGKLFGLRRGDTDFYRTVSRMTYGLLCFGLLFSVVGTVLGGIWANESWGRFWGWDPKENGALMIVLWQLIVLHSRLGGYLRDFGIAMASVFGGMVVAFSWWGVNLLGIGLHSYGFTSGAFFGLLVFYGFETLVLLAGAVYGLALRNATPSPETATA